MNSYNFILVDDITDNKIHNEIILNDTDYYKYKIQRINNELECSTRNTISHLITYIQNTYILNIIQIKTSTKN